MKRLLQKRELCGENILGDISLVGRVQIPLPLHLKKEPEG
jgi:hypothetical protein